MNLNYRITHNDLRHARVIEILEEIGTKSLLDLGCNSATFLKKVARSQNVSYLAGVDISYQHLQSAIQEMEPQSYQQQVKYKREECLTIQLYQGNILDPPCNFPVQTVTLIQVVQHFPKDQLDKLNQSVFEILQPQVAIVTTPNVQFNVHIPELYSNGFRHPQHYFQFDRKEFIGYCTSVCQRYPYEYSVEELGLKESQQGKLTQLAIFRLRKPKHQLIHNQGAWKLLKQIRYPFWKDSITEDFKMSFYNTYRYLSHAFGEVKIQQVLKEGRLKDLLRRSQSDLISMLISSGVQFYLQQGLILLKE